MTNKKSNYQQVKIPPITPLLVEYIDAVPMLPAQMNQAYESMKLDLFYLDALKQRYVAIIEKETKCLMEISRQKKVKYENQKPEFYFVKYKFVKYFTRFHHNRLTRFQSNYGIIMKLLDFFRECLECQAPLTFKRDVFRKKVSMEDTPEDKIYSFKIIALGYYAKNILQPVKKLQSNFLLESLHSNAEKVDEGLNYVQPNEFDTLFKTYANESGLIRKFNQFVKGMPKLQVVPVAIPKFEEPVQLFQPPDTFGDLPTFSETPANDSFKFEDDEMKSDLRAFDSTVFDAHLQNLDFAPPVQFDQELPTVQAFNFKEFNTFVQFFFIALNSNNSTDKKFFATMKAASIRTLFDVYYTTVGNPFVSQIQPLKYFTNIENILKQTPADLGIDKHLYPANFAQKPIREIFKQSKYFIEAINEMVAIQFYNNPLDIAYTMFRVIDNIQNGVKDIMHITTKTVNMAFDDIFGYLLACFAMNPVSSPIDYHRYLSAYEDLRISSTLEYSCTCLKAVLSHFMEIN